MARQTINRYGYFPVRGHDGPLLRDEDVLVYRIGPRGGVKGYEGSCTIAQLSKFYGDDECIQIPSGHHVSGKWIQDE